MCMCLCLHVLTCCKCVFVCERRADEGGREGRREGEKVRKPAKCVSRVRDGAEEVGGSEGGSGQKQRSLMFRVTLLS